MKDLSFVWTVASTRTQEPSSNEITRAHLSNREVLSHTFLVDFVLPMADMQVKYLLATEHLKLYEIFITRKRMPSNKNILN